LTREIASRGRIVEEKSGRPPEAGYPEGREREVKITPLDIRRKEFRRSVRGYSDEEVDIFLDEVADEFERLFQENMELQDRAQRYEEQMAGQTQIKEALEKTLISAQLQAEEMRVNAHKEGELIRRDAEMKARGIVSESYGETQRVQQALVQLKLLEEDFRFKFRSLLEGYLKLITETPMAVTGADVSALAGTPRADALAAATLEPPAAVKAPREAVEEASPVAAASAYAPPAYAPPEGASEPEDEVPTEESGFSIADVNAAVDAYAAAEARRGTGGEEATEEVTAESAPSLFRPVDEPAERESSPHGFFFGRQAEDLDDTFPGEDAVKKDKTRDFEW
jgi:cell division initiation protein